MAATPKDGKRSRRAQIEYMAEISGFDAEYDLPELDGAEYLVEALSELGEGRVSGDRLIAISWTDIKAWADATGSIMTPGEVIILRNLSRIYVNQYYDSIDPACMSPCIADRPPVEDVAAKMKSLFSMLRN